MPARPAGATPTGPAGLHVNQAEKASGRGRQRPSREWRAPHSGGQDRCQSRRDRKRLHNTGISLHVGAGRWAFLVDGGAPAGRGLHISWVARLIKCEQVFLSRAELALMGLPVGKGICRAWGRLVSARRGGEELAWREGEMQLMPARAGGLVEGRLLLAGQGPPHRPGLGPI